jgi:hypothetical protein
VNLDWHGCMESFAVSIWLQWSWFEIKERMLEFEFKLNQVHLPLIHNNYTIKNCRLHISCYSDTRGVTSKQPRKSAKAAEERHLTLLELVHYNICEINGVLTEGVQRYFMTMINDVSRYYNVYLLKTKYEALSCFKIYKAQDEIQLVKNIKRFSSN